MVRAKFMCHAVRKFSMGKNADGTTKFGEEIELGAVAGDSPENKTWSEYTPSGNLKMSITNPFAQGKFEPGKSYFLDFTEAP